MTKKQNTIMLANLIIYLLVLVWVILFHGTLETLNSAFDPDFRSINLYPYFNGVESLLNIFIFVPLGVYITVFFEKLTILPKVGLIAVVSLLFEIMQYILAVGCSDIMDLVNNSIGGLIGIAVCIALKRKLQENFCKIAVPVATLCSFCMTVIILFIPLR